MHTEHPCASLPVTGWSVNIWYCHYHQAFFGSTSCYTQTGEEALTQHGHITINFGPFDTHSDVVRWVSEELAAIQLLPTALDAV